jgi:hypothetical protein
MAFVSSYLFLGIKGSVGDVLELSKSHMYADDLRIYHSRLFDGYALGVFGRRKIFEWFRANFLRLNPAKSMVMPIYRVLFRVLFQHIFLMMILSCMYGNFYL